MLAADPFAVGPEVAFRPSADKKFALGELQRSPARISLDDNEMHVHEPGPIPADARMRNRMLNISLRTPLSPQKSPDRQRFPALRPVKSFARQADRVKRVVFRDTRLAWAKYENSTRIVDCARSVRGNGLRPTEAGRRQKARTQGRRHCD